MKQILGLSCLPVFSHLSSQLTIGISIHKLQFLLLFSTPFFPYFYLLHLLLYLLLIKFYIKFFLLFAEVLLYIV